MYVGYPLDPAEHYGMCPRCGNNTLRTDRPSLNALSRADNQTRICNPCGTEEALGGLLRDENDMTKADWKYPHLMESYSQSRKNGQL